MIQTLQAAMQHLSGEKRLSEPELRRLLTKLLEEECEKLAEWRKRHPVKRAW